MIQPVASFIPEPDAALRRVSILGVTGSVGTQTAALLEHHADYFSVEAITAQRSVEALITMARRLRPRQVVIGEEVYYAEVKEALAGLPITVTAGRAALLEAAAYPVDVTVAGIVGMAGLEPVLSALRAGNNVALANKEPLVAAGELVTREACIHNARLLPVDSEHNAIFQIFDTERRQDITGITLTASGGPFREWSRERMADVTPAQAVAHPNWEMGAKISVDSATLMNKGLECIEAWHLFETEKDAIGVLIHPESIVHGLVSYTDGTVKAVMSVPDMATPIASALAWPARIAVPQPPLNLAELHTLHFEAPDTVRFPALKLAREALQAGGKAPLALNAANEEAVSAFLAGQIDFLAITDVVSHCLEHLPEGEITNLEGVIACDFLVRQQAQTYIMQKKR